VRPDIVVIVVSVATDGLGLEPGKPGMKSRWREWSERAPDRWRANSCGRWFDAFGFMPEDRQHCPSLWRIDKESCVSGRIYPYLCEQIKLD
jgi:hypothetical protein